MTSKSHDPLQQVPDLPIPISLVAGRYLVFDINAAIYLRREHNICGYNLGTLPMIPSQNAFLGLPVILMPEEAQFLVDDGIGFVLDDAKAHDEALYERNHERHAMYLQSIRQHTATLQGVKARDQEEGRRRAIEKQRQKVAKNGNHTKHHKLEEESVIHAKDSLTFDELETSSTTTGTTSTSTTHYVTPTTSALLLPPRPASFALSSIVLRSQASNLLPHVPPTTYPLFRHLQRRNFFMTPGLRFGCQYTTYPGDPLRFHSHFLTVDLGWEDQLDLMDIVGGGRLGTGVKKGFLIGGKDQSKLGAQHEEGEKTTQRQKHTAAAKKDDDVRTFSIEWAVM